MTKLLYEDDQGRIGKVQNPLEGTILVGGNKIAWRKLEAQIIPYTSKKSGALANVSMALDHMVDQVNKSAGQIATIAATAERIDAQHTEVLTRVATQIATLHTFVSDAANGMQRYSHRRAAVGITSNPALIVDGETQTFRLDLNMRGSFDDSTARLMTNSIQGALNTLASQQRDLMFAVQALTDSLAALKIVQNSTIQQVSALADRLTAIQNEGDQ